MPSRTPPSPALRARIDGLARALGILGRSGAAPSFALATTVSRAEASASTGHLDEAAALLDVAIEEGMRAPLQVADPPALVKAMVARATIGLARGERVDPLIERLLRYDPTFDL